MKSRGLRLLKLLFIIPLYYAGFPVSEYGNVTRVGQYFQLITTMEIPQCPILSISFLNQVCACMVSRN